MLQISATTTTTTTTTTSSVVSLAAFPVLVVSDISDLIMVTIDH